VRHDGGKIDAGSTIATPKRPAVQTIFAAFAAASGAFDDTQQY
jgi:hypothetical protein